MEGFQWDGGVCYVAWPSDVDRDYYLKECYMNNQISVWMNDGSLCNNVVVSRETMNWLDFPKVNSTRGSALVFIKESQSNQIIIVGSLKRTDELSYIFNEHNFSLGREYEGKVVKINGNVAEGVMSLMVNGKEKQGKILINLQNEAKDCLLEVNVLGDLKASISQKIEIKSGSEVVITTKSAQNKSNPSFAKVAENELAFGSRKVTINSSEISIEHYDGHFIKINDSGIVVYGRDKAITITNDENSQVKIKGGSVQIRGRAITVGGNMPVLYSKIPGGTSIADVSQIGVSSKVKVG